MKMPIKAGTGLKVKDNKIRLTDLQMLSKSPGLNMGPVSDFIETMTLAVFDVSTLGEDDTEITIKNINIKNDKIDVDGTVWVAPKQSK